MIIDDSEPIDSFNRTLPLFFSVLQASILNWLSLFIIRKQAQVRSTSKGSGPE